ncbi:MAG: hypothetical protein EB079_05850, partial [Verrucomicrobia bacterium]|nr:hypothetical protein [Verrucomicrobiota bacterium]
EPPILADTEKARNCLGLNATVLPGLGTFRHGARLRGLLEMAVAIVGTVWFCKTLFGIAGEMSDGVKLISAMGASVGALFLSALVVIGSWISGVRYGRALLKDR